VFAAVFGLSYSLFRGGRGRDWQSCLYVAVRWVTAKWSDIKSMTRGTPLMRTLAGFVAVTVWFDVLGAVTRARQPWLGMHLVSEILADDSIVQLEHVMGCRNRVSGYLHALVRGLFDEIFFLTLTLARIVRSC
jgi:hypothetical protein